MTHSFTEGKEEGTYMVKQMVRKAIEKFT